MATLHYTIDINASKEKVWDTMLGPETYKEWTGAFHPGSYYEGSWDKGSKIRFVSKDDGQIGGMFGQIAESVQHEYVSIEQLGIVDDGEEDTTSEMAQSFAGSHENYKFTEQDGVTTLDVELVGGNLSDEMAAMFDGMWPLALQKLKEISEN